ncbi:MAG: hypothetical protein LW855_07855 [Alphaproteobacteria bacterium]|jgi:hypothetical protein|nr:hypothetical protein [Alphaproteobacteria bacterium]
MNFTEFFEQEIFLQELLKKVSLPYNSSFEDHGRHIVRQRNVVNNYRFLKCSPLLNEMIDQVKQWGFHDNLKIHSYGAFAIVFHHSSLPDPRGGHVLKIINTRDQDPFCEQNSSSVLVRACDLVVEPTHRMEYFDAEKRGFYIEIQPYLRPLDPENTQDIKDFDSFRQALADRKLRDNDLTTSGVGRWPDGKLALFDRTYLQLNSSENLNWIQDLKDLMERSKSK